MPDAKPAKAEAPGGARPVAAAVPRNQKIILRDLVLRSNIGVTRQERAQPQRIRVNLDLNVVPKRPRKDRIEEVISYSDVARRVRAVCADDAGTNLLETLAARVAEGCLDDPRVTAVRVRIEKLERYADMSAVGVDITFQRADD